MKSFELANKATGHDLRGAISISRAIEHENEEGGTINLNTSLMGIIDHLGERQTLHTNGGFIRSGKLAASILVLSHYCAVQLRPFWWFQWLQAYMLCLVVDPTRE